MEYNGVFSFISFICKWGMKCICKLAANNIWINKHGNWTSTSWGVTTKKMD